MVNDDKCDSLIISDQRLKIQMASLKAEYDALKQQHQFTVMELTDLKESHDKIKQLNNTLLENMMKEPSDILNQIRVIIDGNLYSQKIVDLQTQLQSLRKHLNQEVQKRVQQLIKNTNPAPTQSHIHDLQNCQKCRSILSFCPNCLKASQGYKKLQKVIQQKNQRIDLLRLQIQQKKSEYEVIESRKNNDRLQKLAELEQLNRMLKSNIQDQQKQLKDQQMRRQMLNQQWQTQYNNLGDQFNATLQQLQQYKQYYEQQQQEERMSREMNMSNYQNNKKNHMMKEIQNIVGQLGGRKALGNITNGNGNGTRQSKLAANPSLSRINQDSDFTHFSIKDAINRPNQFTFY